MKALVSRVLVLMVAFLLVLAFTGCDSQQNETETVTEQSVQGDSSSDESVASAEQAEDSASSSDESAGSAEQPVQGDSLLFGILYGSKKEKVNQNILSCGSV